MGGEGGEGGHARHPVKKTRRGPLTGSCVFSGVTKALPLYSSLPPHPPRGKPWSPGDLPATSWRPPATYWTNPQFKIHLDEVDDSQEGGVGEPCCTVLLGLMQKNRRRLKRIGQGTLSIGYAVYKVLGAGSPFITHWMSSVGLC